MFYKGFGRFGGPEVLNSDPNAKQMLGFIRVWSNFGVPRWSFSASLWLARGRAGLFFGLRQKENAVPRGPGPAGPARGRAGFFSPGPENPAPGAGFFVPK